jgi:hypothetical protein
MALESRLLELNCLRWRQLGSAPCPDPLERTSTVVADASPEVTLVLIPKNTGIYSSSNKSGRPTTKPPSGAHRREMSESFDKETYGQRWQIETALSMLKRNLGSALRARKYWAQCRESML